MPGHKLASDKVGAYPGQGPLFIGSVYILGFSVISRYQILKVICAHRNEKTCRILKFSRWELTSGKVGVTSAPRVRWELTPGKVHGSLDSLAFCVFQLPVATRCEGSSVGTRVRKPAGF